MSFALNLVSLYLRSVRSNTGISLAYKFYGLVDVFYENRVILLDIAAVQ